jgi:hypothetical protein
MGLAAQTPPHKYDMKEVTLFADGARDWNRGPGGWALDRLALKEL